MVFAVVPMSVGRAVGSFLVASRTDEDRLRVLRAEREWSQAELAKRTDVSRQTINAVEIGKYDPSLPLAFEIAAVFERSIEEIFDPSGDTR